MAASPPPSPEFIRLRDRFIENPSELAEEELDLLVAVLRDHPAWVVELREQMMVNDLLGQKLAVDRRKFLAQVGQRVGDFERGEEEIYNQVADLRALAEAELERPPAPPKQSVWIKAFAVLAAVLLLGVTFAVVQLLPGSSRQVAVVEQVTGDVQLTRDSVAQTVARGLVVSTGDSIQVPAGSTLQLKYGNNKSRQEWTYVNIAGDSLITIEADAKTQAKRVVMQRGDLLADVAPQRQGAPMIFVTPHALATVLGTQLRLVVAGEETRLDVTEGRVALTRKSDGNSVTVNASETGVASERSLALKQLAWPDERSSVAFLFSGADELTLVRNPENDNFWENPLESKHAAAVTSNHRLLLEGGLFQSPEAGVDIASILRSTNEFTLEIALAADLNRSTSPAIVWGMLEESGARNFAIEQQGGELQLRLRTSEIPAADRAISLGAIVADQPTHWVVTYKSGELVWYRDGVRVGATSEITGDLKNWGESALVVGGDLTGMQTWRGLVGVAAIYRRVLSDSEISRNELAYRVLHRSKLMAETWDNLLPIDENDTERLENIPAAQWKRSAGGFTTRGADEALMTLRSPKGSAVDARCDFTSSAEPYEVRWQWTLHGQPLVVTLRSSGEDSIEFAGASVPLTPVADPGLLPVLASRQPISLQLRIRPEMDSAFVEVLIDGKSRQLAHVQADGMTPASELSSSDASLQIVFPQGQVEVHALKLRSYGRMLAE